jgi:hypothetical protein
MSKRSLHFFKSSKATFSLVNLILSKSRFIIIPLNVAKIKSSFLCQPFKALIISKSSSCENKSRLAESNVSKVILF